MPAQPGCQCHLCAIIRREEAQDSALKDAAYRATPAQSQAQSVAASHATPPTPPRMLYTFGLSGDYPTQQAAASAALTDTEAYLAAVARYEDWRTLTERFVDFIQPAPHENAAAGQDFDKFLRETVAPNKAFDSLSQATTSVGRKAMPIASGVVDYFPDAIAAVAAVSKIGNDQHNPGKPMFWDRTKSRDEADCLMRHFVQRGTRDTDGVLHSAKVAWRALALLQKEIEGERDAAQAETAFYAAGYSAKDTDAG